jgi:ribonuclease HII
MFMVIGIDEVGRGAWAGPLVIGAVMLPEIYNIPGLADSKKVNRALRPDMARNIEQIAFACAVGVVSAEEIDQYAQEELETGIKPLTKATTEAILRALENMPKAGQILIDGTVNYLKDETEYADRSKAILGGDSTVPAIMAASIIAKVHRDQYMVDQAANHTSYGFDTNVGYGTPEHQAAIYEFNICSLHRKFIKPIQALKEAA